MKKKIFLGILIAVACLYYAVRGISLRSVAESLRSADPRWILIAIGIYFVGYVLRAFRWSILLDPIKPVSARTAFGPMVIGFFANNILPLRMGEFVRAHVAGTKFRISRTAALGTILLERLYDTVSFLTTFLAVTLFCQFPAWVGHGALMLAGLCAVLVISLGLIMTHQKRFHQWLEVSKLSRVWKDRLQDVVNNFSQGVSSLSNAKQAFGSLALSLAVWTMEGTFLYLMARALHLPVGFPQAFFLLFFMGLSVTLPQAPGYVGTVELFGVTALTIIGLSKQDSLALILAIHVTEFLYIILLGFWALWSEGLSLHSLAEKETASID